jgi:predicted ferric reductase
MTTVAPPSNRRRKTRTGTAVLVLVLLGLVVPALLAPTAAVAAVAPIPGSPLDAYDRVFALIAYVLMVATIVLGVVLRLRFMQRAVNRSTFYGAHMVLALSALIFGALHGFTFLYQPIWQIGARELTVPFVGGVQRIPVGFGILGTELAVAVGCSVWLQRRLGYHRWLRFHQLAYVAFGLIWLHVFLVHPEPRHDNLVAIGIAAGAGTCLLAFLIRAFPSRSRLRQRAFPGNPGAAR